MTRGVLAVLLGAACLQLQAADPLTFPCQFTDYRVGSSAGIFLYCGIRVSMPLDFAVSIAELDDQGQRLPATARPAQLTLDPATDTHWARVAISGVPLEQEKTYQLYTNRQYGGVDYDVETFDFDTESNVSIVLPLGDNDVDGRVRFALMSKVALDPASLQNASLSEDFGPVHQPLSAAFRPLVLDQPSPITIGIAEILVDPPGPKTLTTHLTIANVRNIFGHAVQVPPKQVISLPGGPKDKDSADLYMKFLNQAGPGAKPGWAADFKFSPQLANMGGGVFFTPAVLADVGLGTVDDNRVTDMIKAGLGVTKFWSGARIQVTPQAQFETDREGHHRNLLFDGDVQYFGPGWLNSIKDRNERALGRQALANLIAGKKLPAADSIPSAAWGWQVQSFMGTEIGHSLSADSVQASDQASSVVLPAYPIARIRPRIAAMLEIRFVSLSLTVIPRYLFATETGTREKQTGQGSSISLRAIHGFRPYGESEIAFHFDQAGHFALSTTYKLGSVPPNFDYVNTVQTGLVLKF